MSKLKKVISNSLEAVKDTVLESGKQAAETVSPSKLLEQALGTGSPKKNEFSEYLKNLGPDLSEEELAKKVSQAGEEDKKKQEEILKNLQTVKYTPDHMKLPEKPREKTAFEINQEEEEKKKAMEEQMRKNQQAVLNPVSTKQAPGGFMAKKKRPQSQAFETSKNIKVG